MVYKISVRSGILQVKAQMSTEDGASVGLESSEDKAMEPTMLDLSPLVWCQVEQQKYLVVRLHIQTNCTPRCPLSSVKTMKKALRLVSFSLVFFLGYCRKMAA